MFIPVDPHQATREQFTANLVDAEVPDSANEMWKKYVVPHQKLLDKLAKHEAMAPNLQQTYMTPANSKNKVYFMWDFVGRTLGLILRIPPDTDVNQIPAAWTDVVSRSAMARQLLLDPSGAMLNSTLEIQYPDQRGRHPALGDEVLAAARELP